MSKPAVAVVVLNYNGLEDTLKCLHSLSLVEYPGLRVVLVDNGSTIDPFPDARRLCPDVIEIATGRNLGFAGGNNRGIAAALDMKCEFVLVLNNDTIVAPSIVVDLLAAFRRDDSLGVVGPVINYMDEPNAVMTDGVRFNPGPGTEFFVRLQVQADHAPPGLVDVDIVNGCCMMVRAQALRTMGAFDESFFIVHEESDLCLRFRSAGLRCAVLGKTLVWHKGSSSFKRTGRSLQRYYDARNLWFLIARHAGTSRGSRSFGMSAWHYAKYAYYRYCVELENGSSDAAEAVLAGVVDALRRRTGPYEAGNRPGMAPLRAVFNLARRA